MPTQRPDLNGVKLQLPGSAPIYLVDNGVRRWIPNPQVFNALFRDWNGVCQDPDIPEIQRGPDIPATAILFRCFDSPKVFLLDHNTQNQNVKRWITSPAVMDHYNFSWTQIHIWNVPLNTIGIPDGSNISNPPNWNQPE